MAAEESSAPSRRHPASGVVVLVVLGIVLAGLSFAHPGNCADEKAADPCGLQAREAHKAAFDAAHPLVLEGDLDAWEARERAYLAESLPWVAACPENVTTRARRLRAMAAVPDVPDLQVLTELHEYFAVCGRVGGVFCTAPGLKLQIVELMASRDLAFAEADEILTAVRTETRAAEKCRKDRDEFCWLLDRATIRLAIAHGALGEARKSIEAVEAALSAAGSRDRSIDPATRKLHDNQQVELIALRGELMEASGSRIEAARLYRRALALGFPDPLLRRRERDLWSELDASSQAALLQESPPAITTLYSEWTKVDRPFELDKVFDLRGVEWSTAKLRGKTVLVNFWATWCAPCLAELPYIQALHERTAASPDLRVITISLDENPKLVAPLLAKNHWTFPVLLGERAFSAAVEGVPQTWIVDASGRVARSTGGFAVDGVDWVGEGLKEMSSVARQTRR